jgi:hypothetical protein
MGLLHRFCRDLLDKASALCHQGITATHAFIRRLHGRGLFGAIGSHDRVHHLTDYAIGNLRFEDANID